MKLILAILFLSVMLPSTSGALQMVDASYYDGWKLLASGMSMALKQAKYHEINEIIVVKNDSRTSLANFSSTITIQTDYIMDIAYYMIAFLIPPIIITVICMLMFCTCCFRCPCGVCRPNRPISGWKRGCCSVTYMVAFITIIAATIVVGVGATQLEAGLKVGYNAPGVAIDRVVLAMEQIRNGTLNLKTAANSLIDSLPAEITPLDTASKATDDLVASIVALRQPFLDFGPSLGNASVQLGKVQAYLTSAQPVGIQAAQLPNTTTLTRLQAQQQVAVVGQASAASSATSLRTTVANNVGSVRTTLTKNIASSKKLVQDGVDQATAQLDDTVGKLQDMKDLVYTGPPSREDIDKYFLIVRIVVIALTALGLLWLLPGLVGVFISCCSSGSRMPSSCMKWSAGFVITMVLLHMIIFLLHNTLGFLIVGTCNAIPPLLTAILTPPMEFGPMVVATPSVLLTCGPDVPLASVAKILGGSALDLDGTINGTFASLSGAYKTADVAAQLQGVRALLDPLRTVLNFGPALRAGTNVPAFLAAMRNGTTHLAQLKPQDQDYQDATAELAALNAQVGGAYTIDTIESFSASSASQQASKASIISHRTIVLANLNAAIAAAAALEAAMVQVDALTVAVKGAIDLADGNITLITNASGSVPGIITKLQTRVMGVVELAKGVINGVQCSIISSFYEDTYNGLCYDGGKGLVTVAIGELMAWSALLLALLTSMYAWKYLYPFGGVSPAPPIPLQTIAIHQGKDAYGNVYMPPPPGYYAPPPGQYPPQ